MMLPYIVEPPPGDYGENTFDLQHYNDHLEITQAIKKKKNINGVIYDIYPFNREYPERFLQLHQQWHTDMNAALGLNGNDLSVVDVNNKEQMKSWFDLNFQEHRDARTALGI